MKNRKSEAAKILLENGFELEEVNQLLNPIKIMPAPLPGAAPVPQIHIYPVRPLTTPAPLGPFSPNPWQPTWIGGAVPSVCSVGIDVSKSFLTTKN